MTVLALLAALAAASAAPAVPAAETQADAWATLAKYVDEAGLTMADLPPAVPVTTLDMATGGERVDEMTWGDAFAYLGLVGDATEPQPAAPHEVHTTAGFVKHGCSDGTRICYFWHDEDASAAYTPLNGATGGALPVKGLDPITIHGRYIFGLHRAGSSDPTQGVGVDSSDLSEMGDWDFDRSMAGSGVGTVKLIKFQWGNNLYISFGQMEAVGAFTFCTRETTDECATLAEQLAPLDEER